MSWFLTSSAQKLAKKILVVICLVALLGPSKHILQPKIAEASAVSRIQFVANGNGAGGTTVDATWPQATVAGRFLVALVAFDGGSSITVTPPSASWNLAVRSNRTNGQGVAIYYYPNAPVHSGTTTWTLSTAKSATIVLAEYADLELASVLDQTASANGNSSTVNSGTTASTVQAKELAIGALANRDFASHSAQTNGFSEITEAHADHSSLSLQEKFLTSTGTQQVQATLSTGREWAGAIATFKVYSDPIPIGSFNTATQRTNGTGKVDISFESNDGDDNKTKAKIQYDNDAACNGPWTATTLDQTAGATADFNDSGGSPSVVNADAYQVGTTANRQIITNLGSNTVGVVWNSQTDLPAADGSYCLRLTVNDGTQDQATPATKTLTLDNAAPSGLTALTAGTVGSASQVLTWTAVTETNFDHYEIWFGANQADVQNRTGSASEWDNVDDANMATRTTNNTTIVGLTPGTQYFYKIWAIDNFGNQSTVSDIAVVTNPGAKLVQTISNGVDGGTSLSATWPAATLNGNLLIAVIGATGGSGVGITPPSGGWTLAVRSNDTGLFTAIYYIANASSQSGSSTWTLSSAERATLTLAEYSGVEKTSPLDKTAAAVGSSSTLDSGTTTATTQAAEVAVAGIAQGHGGADYSSPTNNFAEQSEYNVRTNASGINTGFFDKNLSATGVQQVQTTSTESASSAGVIATFKLEKTVRQSGYRVFANVDSTNVGAPLAGLNTPATLSATGDPFRVRLLTHGYNATYGLNEANFKLQYVGKGAGTCSNPTGGTPATYTDVTTSTLIAYKDNPTPADGVALASNANDPTHGADAVLIQTYEEGNNLTNSVNSIAAGQDAMWDFALFDNGASAASTFCLRLVNSDGTTFAYSFEYPEIMTAGVASLSLTIVDSFNRDGSAGGGNVNFQSVDPLGSPWYVGQAPSSATRAVRVRTTSDTTWTTYISGDPNFLSGGDFVPIGQLSWAKDPHSDGAGFTSFSTADVAVDSGSANTPGGTDTDLDYQLVINWLDKLGTYSATITFTAISP